MGNSTVEPKSSARRQSLVEGLTHERVGEPEPVDTCFFHATVSNHRRFIITLMVEALDTDPRLSEEFRRILRGMRAFLAEVVERGQREGTMRRDLDAASVAATIAGGIMGAEIQHYQDPEQIDLRAVLDTLIEQLADWLATAPTRGAKPAA